MKGTTAKTPLMLLEKDFSACAGHHLTSTVVGPLFNRLFSNPTSYSEVPNFHHKKLYAEGYMVDFEDFGRTLGGFKERG